MRTILMFFIMLVCYQYTIGQDTAQARKDSIYKEDQFYFGVTYNALGNMPDGMSQNGFSSGFHLGYIKDMPLHRAGHWALGLGLGYSTNSFNQNLLISKDELGTYTYTLLTSNQFTKNKFSMHFIEIPFELRWRTSTLETYKFWRVYTGFKLGYLFYSATKFANGTERIKQKNISNFNTLQYGLTLSVGYNTWNAHVYYALNPVFKKEVTLNGTSIDMHALKIGLMFYIL